MESIDLGFEMRSIPASAGEPMIGGYRVGGVKVYPRECGGTDGVVSTVSTIDGLSPRVRGNHL